MQRYISKHSKKKNDLSKKILITSLGTITLISTASLIATPVKADDATGTNAANEVVDTTSSTTPSVSKSEPLTSSTNITTDESNLGQATNEQSNSDTFGTNDISEKNNTNDTPKEKEDVAANKTNSTAEVTDTSLSNNDDTFSQTSNDQTNNNVNTDNDTSNQVDQSKIENVDASVWMPDQTLRTFIENQISENVSTPANDANLWSYINTPIFSQLVNGVYNKSNGMTSLEGLQYATYLNTIELSNTSLMSNGDGLKPLTQMPNLTFLSLKSDSSINMSLSDFVHKYISNDTKLGNFTLDTMNITGSIPDFSDYKELYNLTLNKLKLTGNIPSFSANTNLKILILAHNQLSGSLPDFSANTLLFDLRVNNNLLSGKLPDLTKNPLDTVFLYFNNYFSSSLINNEGITYGVYQTIQGGNYTIGDGTDNTFDPITGFLFGAQDHTNGSTANNYKYTLSSASTFMPGTKVYLYNSNTGKYDDVSSQFTQTPDTDNPLGFNLTANNDTISGRYMIYVTDPDYIPGNSEGYSAFRFFDLNKTILVTSDDPKTPGQPIDSKSDVTWPEETSIANLNKTITENVNYQYADGSLASTPVTKTVKYTRSVLVDPTTGKILQTTDWKVSGNDYFSEIKSPIIPGYTADKTIISQINDITPDSKNLEFTVTYKKISSGSSSNNNSGNPSQPDNTSTNNTSTNNTSTDNTSTNNTNTDNTVNPTDPTQPIVDSDNSDQTTNIYMADTNQPEKNNQINASSDDAAISQSTGVKSYYSSPIVDSKNVNSESIDDQLPQTGNTKYSSISILGAFILGIMGLTKFKKHED